MKVIIWYWKIESVSLHKRHAIFPYWNVETAGAMVGDGGRWGAMTGDAGRQSFEKWILQNEILKHDEDNYRVLRCWKNIASKRKRSRPMAYISVQRRTGRHPEPSWGPLGPSPGASWGVLGRPGAPRGPLRRAGALWGGAWERFGCAGWGPVGRPGPSSGCRSWKLLKKHWFYKHFRLGHIHPLEVHKKNRRPLRGEK